MGIDSNLLFVALLAVESLVYLILVFQALRQRAGQEESAWLLSLYALAAILLGAFEMLWRLDLLPLTETLVWRFQTYGVLLLSVLLVLVNRAFLRLPGRNLWLGSGAIFFVLIALFSGRVLPLPEFLWPGTRYQVPGAQLGFFVLLLGWVFFLAAAILTTRAVFRRTRQPLHRNRLSYWMPVLLLVAANDLLLLSGRNAWGGALRLLATWLMTYMLIRHRLPDAHRIFRETVNTLIGIVLLVGAYLVGYILIGALPAILPGYDPFWIGFAVVGLLVVVCLALFGMARRLVYRLMPVESYNPSQTLRDYSISISNILDVERLATVAVGLIIEAMDIRRGFLFLVDKDTDLHGRVTYRLRAVRGAGERPLRVGVLSAAGPFARFFAQGHRPLLQYDVDMLPEFRQGPASEREWLSSLDTEVYVPIFAKKEWIGMLALGAKSSGNRYTDDDLNVLTTLANQTAVALENARLVENLIRLNQEIRQAYQALDRANRNLERLDQTKSDFISIASHELRTPLTVLRGYTEMLLEDPAIKENPYHYQTIEGIHKGTLRLHEIMDSMFDIAQIDARTLELSWQAVDVPELIRSVSSGMAAAVRERGQTLTLDLPALPAIKADPKTLRKVFQHLLSNAIKFTPNGGKITILGRALPPNQRDLPEGGVEIVVADTGVGVAPEYRDIIFTKFYQPEEDLNKHSTGKTKFKGSGAGLGLALSRGIVEAHGGRIWVESPGYDEVTCPGSQFHVVLPLRRQGESETVRISEGARLKL